MEEEVSEKELLAALENIKAQQRQIYFNLDGAPSAVDQILKYIQERKLKVFSSAVALASGVIAYPYIMASLEKNQYTREYESTENSRGSTDPVKPSAEWRRQVRYYERSAPQGGNNTGRTNANNNAYPKHFLVSASRLNLRSAPNINGRIVGSLGEGQCVEIRDVIKNDWGAIAFKGDSRWRSYAYASMDYLDEASKAEVQTKCNKNDHQEEAPSHRDSIKYYRVAGLNAQVYAGPGQRYALLGHLESDSCIRAEASPSGDWISYRIDNNGYTLSTFYSSSAQLKELSAEEAQSCAVRFNSVRDNQRPQAPVQELSNAQGQGFYSIRSGSAYLYYEPIRNGPRLGRAARGGCVFVTSVDANGWAKMRTQINGGVAQEVYLEHTKLEMMQNPPRDPSTCTYEFK